MAYKVYVCPVLEYNSTVWNPHLVKHIDVLERVQRRFTKRLPGLQSFDYESRLTTLHLRSLEERRLHNDLLMCYKILFGILAVETKDFFTMRPAAATRGHP